VRPRFGLMRGREFIMKDGYSFHATYEDCRREYEHMRSTYTRIFRRCGLQFRAVEADTGAIGGTMSHEFQVLAASGEDLIVSCSACDYAANIEKAEALDGTPSHFEAGPLAEVATPNMRTIEEVSAFLKTAPERFIKTLLFMADDKPVAALVRGDDQISEAKLKRLLDAATLRLAEEAEIRRITGAPQGFAGPVNLAVPIVSDLRLAACTGMVTGANKQDMHLKGVEQERDFANARFADLRTAHAGDTCARCKEGMLEEHRGIEVGQVFYLGKKYSTKLGAAFLDPDGNEVIMEMGTYGIGVTRTMAAAIEQNHDERGIVWPTSIAPYEVLIVPVKNDDETSAVAQKLYDTLWAAGVEALLDDRDERAGVKFNDADLIGVPWRITIGPRGLKAGTVELKARREADARELPIDGAAAEVAKIVRAERAGASSGN
jgi:prolyl-tRNA synthetase